MCIQTVRKCCCSLFASVLVSVASSAVLAQTTPPSPIQYLEGHASPIHAVGYSPDGKILFSGDTAGTLKTWDRATGQLLSSGAWHDGAILTLALSPDGQQIVTAGTGKQIIVSDVAIPRPLLDFTGVPGTPTSIAISRDGTTLLTGDESSIVSLWDPATGRLVRNYSGATAALVGVGWLPATKSVIGAAADGTLREWNVDNAQLGGVVYTSPSSSVGVPAVGSQIVLGGQDGSIRRVNWPPKPATNLSGHNDIVPAVAISADNRFVISGGYDQVLQISQLSNGQPVRTLSAQVGRIFSAALSHDGALAASGAEPGTIQLWRTADGTPGPVLSGHVGGVNDLSFHPSKALVLSASLDGSVRLWEVPATMAPVRGHSQPLAAVALTSNGQLLVTGSLDKTVRVSTVSDGQPKFAMNDFPQPVQSLAISSNGTLLGVGDLAGDLQIRNMDQGAMLSTWGAHVGAVTGLHFLGDGERAVSSGADGTVKIWTLPLPTPATVKAHGQAISTLVITHDGKKLVSAGLDEWIRVYSLDNQQQIAGWKNKTGPVTALAISADDKILVTGTSTGKWQSWSFPEGVEKQQQPMGHAGAIHSIAIHPQSGELATAGTDGLVKLWKGDEMPRVLAGHSGPVLAIAFTPDGASVISGGADASVRRWNVSDGVQAQAYAGHQGQVTGVMVSTDSTTIVSSSLDKTVRIWTAASGEAKVLTQISPIIASDFVSEKKRIATTGEDLIVRIWDTTTGRELQRFPASKAALKAVRLTPSLQGFVTGGTDGDLTFSSISAQSIMLADEVKVHDLAVTPDGSHLVTCGEDKTAKLWNMKGELVRPFSGSGTALRFLAVRSDGTQVASGGDPLFSQANVLIWNLADGTAVRTLTAPAAVMGLAATFDGHWAVSCADKKIRVYSGDDGTLLEEITTPAVTGEMAVVPNLPLIAGAGADNNGYLLNRGLKRVFKGHTGSVTSVQWTPDGNRFLSAGIDQTIRLWNAMSGKELGVWTPVNSPINSLTLTGDGKKVAATTDDRRLLVWDLPADNGDNAVQSAAPVLTITGTVNLRGVATNQTGSDYSTAGEDGAIYLWDGTTGKLKERLVGHTGAALSSAMSGDGSTVISCSADRTVKRWTPAVTALTLIGDKPVIHVHFSPEGKSFFTSDGSPLVQRWSVETMQSDKQWTASAPVRSLSLSEDGHYLAVGCENQKVHVWNLEASTETTWDCPVPMTSVAVAQGGRKLIVSGNDHILRVCGLSIVNGQPAWTLTQTASGHTDAIVCLALPDDDRQLFSISKDRTIKRWLAASSIPRQTFEMSSGIVHGADFSPDGKLLATTGSDRKIQIRDVVSGELKATCEGHTAGVKSVAFSKQGDMLVSGSLDGSIRFWDLTGKQTQMIADPTMKGINTVAMLPNGSAVFAAGLSRTWNAWNPKDLVLARSGIGHAQSIVRISNSLSGNRMATIDESAHLCLWDSTNGQLRYHIQLPMSAGYAVAYAPDNLEVLVGGNDTRLIRLAVPPNVQ